ncbi:MAG TPA: cytochrome c3 family protein [Geobacteraceae bacterium]|nr:cytochrome c3 family protein [Geobacteraceae bacterium]
MYAVRNWLIGVVFMVALIASPAFSGAKTAPDTVELNSLVNLYEKVHFNHAKHISIVKDCADCHHHTAGTLAQNPNCVKCHKNSGATANVACRSCHLVQPFSAAALRQKDRSAYHNDILGLKGAYHQACSGCHQKMGGPTGCQDCHARKKGGDAFYSAGAFAPPQARAKQHGQ